jgi:YjbE family integral membrane protein
MTPALLQRLTLYARPLPQAEVYSYQDSLCQLVQAILLNRFCKQNKFEKEDVGMEILSMEFLTALLAIIAIDLVLAGDNAIVIGLAARNLPKEQQKKVIFWGTFGAIAIRSLMTLMVVWLLQIPGLLLVGGILLIWIAYKLLVDDSGHGEVAAAVNFWAAVRTIVIADTVMGVDNVIAVAGAAHGSFLLVVLGLLISVPIIVWGSTLFITLTEKYPWIVDVGSAILAWTAAKMIVNEKFLKAWFDENSFIKYSFEIVIIIAVLVAGRLYKRNKARKAAAN